MRQARILVNGVPAGILEEVRQGTEYVFKYFDDYNGDPVSLTMPVRERVLKFNRFPPFFDGVLPEGLMLDGLLRTAKIDNDDMLSQLIAVGKDLVGAVTVEEIP
jgi:serine/threonine-protein kinase HipA